MSIQAENISKLYGEQRALDNMSFAIGTGEVVGFLGPNGAGKSTMMKIITCFLPPSEGNARVCGFDVIEQSMEVRKRVGYLPENNPLYTDMYVREYLRFIGGIHQLENVNDKVENMISRVGLSPEAHKEIGALSKGYRQRVGLAQAMLHDPEVLVLDEPTSGLDPNQLVEIRELIREIGKEKTVLLSTHIMQEVEAICSRVVIINKGQIVADEPIANLSQLTSKGKQILKVEFNQTINPEMLRTIPGVTGVQSISDRELRIEADGEGDIRPELFRFAVDQGLEVLTLSQLGASMEDVFKELTRK